jgi:hypothetical protein
MTMTNDKQAWLVIAEAERWLGTTARGNNFNPFAEAAGYNGQPWAGMFIDYIFHQAGVLIPSCAYTPTAIAEFVKHNRLFNKPRPGDIAFYSLQATGTNYGMPHCGLVVKTDRWQADGLVQTIEADTGSGLPKADQSVAGVYWRVRTQHEVLGFGRPASFKLRPGRLIKATTGSGHAISIEACRPGRRNKAIGLVQLALSKTVGLGPVTVDMFDTETQRAYSHWQRILGYVGNDATGVPDERSLRVLGQRTGIFQLDASLTS